MKAHVIAPIQERVLSFAIDGAVQPQLSQILQELSIEERPVTMEELGQDVGYLAVSYTHLDVYKRQVQC